MKTNPMNRAMLVMLGACCYISVFLLLQSYGNIVNHPIINDLIVDRFIADKTLNTKYDNYTFVFDGQSLQGDAVTNLGMIYRSYGESVVTKSPREWIKHGGLSADEPEVQASVRHFYDPTAPTGEHYLRNVAWGPIMALAQEVYPNPKIDQMEWGLVGDVLMSESDPLNHQYTWEHGKKWMKDALEQSNSGTRSQLMAKAWRALGETLHMIGDFGHPAHVRDDSHPAPLGYTSFFGDGDPYEEMMASEFRRDTKVGFPYGTPDPALVGSIKGMSSIRPVAQALATWTNSHFFTGETIMGDVDGKHIYHIAHPQRELPSPRLQDLSYNTTDMYYETTIGGQKVKMCRDASYLWSRCYPYIDRECVLSQARAIIPTIAAVGAKTMDLFIPTLRVELKMPTPSQVQGSVVHTTDAEYPTAILYNGPVTLEHYNKAGQKKATYSVVAHSGTFSYSNLSASDGEKIRAVVECGGMYLNSPFQNLISTSTRTLLNMDNVVVRADFVWKSEYAMGTIVRDQFSDWVLNSTNSTISASSLSLNKATTFMPHSVSSLTISFNPLTQKVDSFRIVATLAFSGGQNKSVYTIQSKGSAPAAVWYDAGGVALMTLDYNQMQSMVDYTETRYELKVDDKGNAYWAVSAVLTQADLKAIDNYGHSTSIKFYSNSTH